MALNPRHTDEQSLIESDSTDDYDTDDNIVETDFTILNNTPKSD